MKRSMVRADVYDAIDEERDYQDKKWSDKPSKTEYLVYIQHHLNKAIASASTEFPPHEDVMDEIRKITALGVACMEHNGVNRR